ncbi:DUF6776 family protein [Halopseudomonas pachastrellae]|nr:DUF6776 family protein [Halopseudomonas pachastrellae]
MTELKRPRPQSYRDHHVSITPRESRARQRWRRAVLIMLLTAIPVSAWLGRESALRNLAPLTQERDLLVEQQQQLMRELEEQRQRYHQMEVDLLVARESVAEGQESSVTWRRSCSASSRALRSIRRAGAQRHDARFAVQAFELHATDDPQVFAYKVMVSRVGDESEMLEASLDLEVSGERDGKAETLTLADLAPEVEADALALNFRYFQVVPARSEQARLSLPEGFVPQQITLIARHGGETLVEQSFEWTVTGAAP